MQNKYMLALISEQFAKLSTMMIDISSTQLSDMSGLVDSIGGGERRVRARPWLLGTGRCATGWTTVSCSGHPWPDEPLLETRLDSLFCWYCCASGRTSFASGNSEDCQVHCTHDQDEAIERGQLG